MPRIASAYLGPRSFVSMLERQSSAFALHTPRKSAMRKLYTYRSFAGKPAHSSTHGTLCRCGIVYIASGPCAAHGGFLPSGKHYQAFASHIPRITAARKLYTCRSLEGKPRQLALLSKLCICGTQHNASACACFRAYAVRF